jgi:decaprenylphospho-beta-D-ribofuranose 2-oxidase
MTTTQRLTGWGRSSGSLATVHRAGSADDVVRLLAATSGPVLARGLGRSYGDAAQNGGGTVVLLPARPHRLDLDAAARTVRVGAGTSIDDLLRALVPRGWRLPVMPGTRYVTVGGAVAADVHGKNHHADGSFGRWVRRLVLVDGCGDVRTLSPDDDADAFWATVGGMGLTGVVTDAVLSVEPIVSTRMRVRTRRFRDLDAVLAAMEVSPHRYHVAWVDATPGAGFGRSVLDEGDDNDVPDETLRFAPRPTVPVPAVPVNVVRPWLTKLFNELWWRRAPADETRLVPMARFFHPLDGLGSWSRAYGRRGFLQWQIAVPFAAASLVQRSLRLLSDSGALPSLVVLKRFGDSTPAPLSFPMPGWTLAVDVPAGAPRLADVLARLDDEVAAAGGRVYLAKDARMSAAAFARMYPRLDEWREVRRRLDPHGRFSSDLARRLELL